MKYYYHKFNTPMGEFTLFSEEEELIFIATQDDLEQPFQRLELMFVDNLAVRADDRPIMIEAQEQILAYFEGELEEFSLPLKFLYGTPLQHEVWKQLQEVKYGQRVTYSELASKTTSPEAIRAVATAVGLNPFAIVVPCHRVVRKNGSIGNYRGGSDMKEQLLTLETRN